VEDRGGGCEHGQFVDGEGRILLTEKKARLGAQVKKQSSWDGIVREWGGK
jgi:hypothetical protein